MVVTVAQVIVYGLDMAVAPFSRYGLPASLVVVGTLAQLNRLTTVLGLTSRRWWSADKDGMDAQVTAVV